MELVKTYKNAELINNKFENAKLPKIRNEFIAKLENALMFLNYKDLNMYHSDSRNKVNLKNFDGAWLVDISLKHDDDENFCFHPFGSLQVTPDMFPNLNIKLFNLSGEQGYLSKYRFLEPKEKRNLLHYKYVLSERVGLLDYGGQKWWTDENGFGFNKMHKLESGLNVVVPTPICLKKGFYFDPRESDKMVNKWLKEKNSWYYQTLTNLHMALQLSLTYDYEWSCYIRENSDSIGVRIPIHPSSSKEVFMMRNIPDGKSRRRAIVNFVKKHYRTVRGNGNERKVLIEKHFRGDLKFNWRGLEVHVTPSPYDLRKYKSNKKFK